MARGKGTANLAASLEVLAGAPLDARDICPTVADLYVASNWTYKYIGMKTTVQATGDTYRLVNLDVTQESSWVKEGSSGGGGGSMNYSTDEQVVGTWIDGKPLYQKTFTMTFNVADQWIEQNHGISNLDTVVEMKGVVTDTTSPSANFYSADGYYGGTRGKCLFANGTTIQLYTNGGNKAYITMRYTKTTD